MDGWIKNIYSEARLINRNRLRKRHLARQPKYSDWINNFDTTSPEVRKVFQRRLKSLDIQPKISLVMPTYNSNIIWLKETIDSVKNQIYQNWELCIADDASTDIKVKAVIQSEAQKDSRIKFIFREENGHICAASNSALSLVTSDYVGFIDHDDIIREHALLFVAEAIQNWPEAKLFYSDEDKLDINNNRCDPHFKSNWNPELLWSQSYLCHLTVYRTDLIRKVGGFRLSYEGSQDHDLALRCTQYLNSSEIIHIPHILYTWRQHPQSTSIGLSVKPYAATSGLRAVQDHLVRLGIKASVNSNPWGSYSIKMLSCDDKPKVSIIIPTRNRLDLLEPCISSILNRTIYSDYEILIIDNGSDNDETLKYLQIISTNPRINVIRDNRDFNYSALNNNAVSFAKGEYVVLLNNDTEVISPDWLDQMVGTANLPEVGVVGARLWYTNFTLQHGGVVMGLSGLANHAHRGLNRDDPGYMGRAQLLQEFCAVTAACLLVRKDLYLRAGGLDEKHLVVAFNDVDFCLRIRSMGHRILWNPNVELFHHESVSRGKDQEPAQKARADYEISVMRERWRNLVDNDPLYNPNLSLDGEGFGLSYPPRVSLLTPWYQSGNSKLQPISHPKSQRKTSWLRFWSNG